MSKARREDRPVIVKHRHCLVCAMPIPMDKQFCGTKCEAEYRRLERRRRYTFILMILLFPLLLLLLSLLRGIFGGG